MPFGWMRYGLLCKVQQAVQQESVCLYIHISYIHTVGIYSEYITLQSAVERASEHAVGTLPAFGPIVKITGQQAHPPCWAAVRCLSVPPRVEWSRA